MALGDAMGLLMTTDLGLTFMYSTLRLPGSVSSDVGCYGETGES